MVNSSPQPAAGQNRKIVSSAYLQYEMHYRYQARGLSTRFRVSFCSSQVLLKKIYIHVYFARNRIRLHRSTRESM